MANGSLLALAAGILRAAGVKEKKQLLTTIGIQSPKIGEESRRTLKLGSTLVFHKYFQGHLVIQYCRTHFFPPSVIHFQIASVHLPISHTDRVIALLHVPHENVIKAQKYAKLQNNSSKRSTLRTQNRLKCKGKECLLAASSIISAHWLLCCAVIFTFIYWW